MRFVIFQNLRNFLFPFRSRKPLMFFNLFIQMYGDPFMLLLMILSILSLSSMISLESLGCICWKLNMTYLIALRIFIHSSLISILLILKSFDLIMAPNICPKTCQNIYILTELCIRLVVLVHLNRMGYLTQKLWSGWKNSCHHASNECSKTLLVIWNPYCCLSCQSLTQSSAGI